MLLVHKQMLWPNELAKVHVTVIHPATNIKLFIGREFNSRFDVKTLIFLYF